MGVNKIQITLIALFNAISAIYSYICLSNYGIVYHSFNSDPSRVWLSLILMSGMTGLVAIYFTLMVIYGILCTCLTGDNSNQKQSFSLCGCFSLMLYFACFTWGFSLYTTVSESVKNLIIWKAFVFQLFTPVTIAGICILFFIYRLCFLSKKERNYDYQTYNDQDNLV